MNGYIKLHRKLLDWEWYDEPNTARLFIHCLIKANHKTNTWRGIEVEKGSFITSHNTLANELGLSIQNIRTAIKNLKSTNEITIETTNKYTRVIVVKWSLYQVHDNEINKQDNTQGNNQVTINQHASNKQVTTNNNDKKEKNEKNEEKIYREFAHLSMTVSEFEKLIDKGYTEEQIEMICNNIENYKGNKKYTSLYLTALNWLKREYPNPKKETRQIGEVL